MNRTTSPTHTQNIIQLDPSPAQCFLDDGSLKTFNQDEKLAKKNSHSLVKNVVQELEKNKNRIFINYEHEKLESGEIQLVVEKKDGKINLKPQHGRDSYRRSMSMMGSDEGGRLIELTREQGQFASPPRKEITAKNGINLNSSLKDKKNGYGTQSSHDCNAPKECHKFTPNRVHIDSSTEYNGPKCLYKSRADAACQKILELAWDMRGQQGAYDKFSKEVMALAVTKEKEAKTIWLTGNLAKDGDSAPVFLNKNVSDGEDKKKQQEFFEETRKILVEKGVVEYNEPITIKYLPVESAENCMHSELRLLRQLIGKKILAKNGGHAWIDFGVNKACCALCTTYILALLDKGITAPNRPNFMSPSQRAPFFTHFDTLTSRSIVSTPMAFADRIKARKEEHLIFRYNDFLLQKGITKKQFKIKRAAHRKKYKADQYNFDGFKNALRTYSDNPKKYTKKRIPVPDELLLKDTKEKISGWLNDNEKLSPDERRTKLIAYVTQNENGGLGITEDLWKKHTSAEINSFGFPSMLEGLKFSEAKRWDNADKILVSDSLLSVEKKNAIVEWIAKNVTTAPELLPTIDKTLEQHLDEFKQFIDAVATDPSYEFTPQEEITMKFPAYEEASPASIEVGESDAEVNSASVARVLNFENDVGTDDESVSESVSESALGLRRMNLAFDDGESNLFMRNDKN